MTALLLVVLSLFFMCMTVKSRAFSAAIEKAEIITYPLQYIVDAPIRFVRWLGASLVNQQDLISDNSRLRAEVLMLQAKLQHLLVLEKENQTLHELLQSKSQVVGRVEVARILAIDVDPMLHQFVLNVGSNHQSYVGQPVLDGYGVMGQVVAVNPETSKVLMLTDRRFAIPAEDKRNGLRAIVVGQGGQAQALLTLDIPKTADIKVGDCFVTSGFALRFPVGYPVGVVSAVNRLPGQAFLQVVLAPAAHIHQTQEVLLAWPAQAALAQYVKKTLSAPLVKPVGGAA